MKRGDALVTGRRIRQTIGRVARVSRSLTRIRDTLEVAVESRPDAPIIVEWAHRGLVSLNWGDKLNPEIVRLVSGRRAVPRAEVLNIARRPVYYVIGSGLGGVVDPRSVIWGTGFLRYDQVPLVRPQHIAAVRGPLSRQKYLDAGIECPEVYGDPAALYPLYYKPNTHKKYILGVIPHYRERHLRIYQELAEVDGVTIIDILGGLTEVVDQIAECEAIASSSLHGLIAADAYGVPSVWIRASNLPKGDFFKYHDYLLSVGRDQMDPVTPRDSFNVQELLDKCRLAPNKIDTERLLHVCPFREGDIPALL